MILTAPILSSASETAWSQIHTFSPLKKEKATTYGSLFSVISLSQEEINLDLAAFGKEIISRLQEEYYGQKITASVLEHLKNALQKISQEFSQNQDLQLTLITAIVLDQFLYFAVSGPGKILLLRGTRLATILSSQKPELISASGLAKKNDLFLLATTPFFQSLNSQILFQTLKNNPPKKAAEIFTPLLHEKNQVSKKAALICQIKFLPEEKIHPEPHATPPTLSDSGVVQGPTPSHPFLPSSPSLPKKPSSRPSSTVIPGLTRNLSKIIPKTLSLLKKPFEKAPTLYLKADKEKQKKTLLSIGLILFFLLIMSTVLGALQRVKNQKETQFQKIFQEIEYHFEQGKTLSTINPQLAQERLQEASQILSSPKETYQKEAQYFKKLTEMEEKINTLLKEVKREYTFPELPLFFNLGLIKKDLKAQDLSFFKGQFFILGQDGTLAKLESQTRASQILGKHDQAQLIANQEENLYLLSAKGIFQMTNGQEKLLIEPQESEGEIIDFASFSNSLYLLEKSPPEIYKFPALEQGFGRRQRWLSPGVELTQTPLSFSINGYLWLATQDKVEKLAQGNFATFSFNNLEPQVENLIDLYTQEDCQFLYLLEKNRALVVSKEGQYQSQYRWQNEEPQKIIADEENKKIFLIKDEKIWALDIQ